MIVPKPAATRQASRRPAPRRASEPVRATPPPAPEPQPVAEYVAADAVGAGLANPIGPAPEIPVEPAITFEEIRVPSESVIGVQLDTTVSSESARVEDRVEGRMTRDLTVDGRVALPAGTRLIGAVSQVERGGKFRERARIAVTFHTAQLRDGTRLPLRTTAIVRDGDAPSRESAAKVGGSAVGGAVLGAILGGAKGAVIGGTAGAAGGAAVVAAGDRNPAILAAGTTVSVRLMEPVTVTVER